MKNAHNITNRFTGSVIFTAEIQVADDAPMALRLGAATAVAVAAKANLSGADLSGANLRHADLSDADLSGANLSCADLSCADLSGADLRGADLRGANLRGANLSDADLSDAGLSGANLSGANLNCAAEITRLRGALDLIARYRYDCHAYDDDMGHPLRDFDVEDVRIMEYAAKTALGDTHQ